MDEIKKRYDELVKKREKIIDRLKVLQKHKIVKEYNNLRAENTDLLRSINNLSALLECEHYDECDHLLVNTSNLWERDYYGCIKCGLHDDILTTYDTNNPVMFSYLANQKNHSRFRNAKLIHEYCDLELAKAIYQKIVDNHPDIDEDKLIKYFENSLDHIRNIEINQDRKESRAKRLNLSANFKKWK